MPGMPSLTKSSLFISLAVIATLLAGPAFAAVPVSITQQGKLLDDEGDPMTGEHTLHFAIYDDPSAGDLLWSDEVTVDLGDTGVYTATLGGQENPIDATLLQEGEAFMELTVGSDAMEPRLQMTSVPFAALAQRAAVAESVTEGSITSESLAPGAVTADAVDSIDWDQITDVPDTISNPVDTLEELSCSDEEIAILSGDEWTCGPLPSYSGEDFAQADQLCDGDQVAVGVDDQGLIVCGDPIDTTYDGSDFAVSDQTCSGDQVAVGINADGSLICDDQSGLSADDVAHSNQDCSGDQVVVGLSSDGSLICDDQADTTYTAGTGLTLSGDEFSVTDDSFLACSGATCPQGDASRLYYDANTSGSYWIGRAGTDLATGTDFDVWGDLSADGSLEVDDRSRLNDRVSINQDPGDNPVGALHVGQTSYHRGITLEAPEYNDVTHFWNIHSYDDLGTNAGTFQFRHRQDSGGFSIRARIDPDDGSYEQVSDARLKEDVRYLDGILGDFLQLRPAQYRMTHQDRDSDPKLGLLAQEVGELFPHLVTYDEREDLYTIGYAGFSVLAVQAIREQQDIIDAKVDRLNSLESEMAQMEQRLQRLEQQQ